MGTAIQDTLSQDKLIYAISGGSLGAVSRNCIRRLESRGVIWGLWMKKMVLDTYDEDFLIKLTFDIDDISTNIYSKYKI